MRCIGIFGGTFDPVHYGHLRTAFELLERTPLDTVRFVPCSIPPHRSGRVTDSSVRARMLEAAIADAPGFALDLRELERPGPSYTVETLQSLRADHPDDSLCLLLGMDAFLQLPTWHQWERLLELANIVVANRPGWRLPDTNVLGELLSNRLAASSGELQSHRLGRIHVEEVTQLEIASTEIKASIRGGVSAKYLLPDAVWEIIIESGCYGG